MCRVFAAETNSVQAESMIGPSLPPHLQNKGEASNAEDTIGTRQETTIPARSAVTGPQLPPHLLAAREAKRKRKLEESSEGTDESSHGPAPPPKRPAKA